MINSISLSGNWKLHIETECGGIPAAYEDSIDLPDTLSNAKKAPYTDWKADGFLPTLTLMRGLRGSHALLK